MEGQDLLLTVLGEKVYNRFALHKFVEAGGTLPISLFGIRLIPSPSNPNFVTLQIVTRGINSQINYDIKARPKQVIIKEAKPKKPQVEFTSDQETLL